MSDFSYKKNEYICLNPFYRIDIGNNNVYCCCPTWIKTPIADTNNLDKVLDSEILKKIQESVIDGSYSYCNDKICPFLLNLVHNGKVAPVFRKKTTIDVESLYDITGKLELKLNTDNSCNLSCPSCRTSVIYSNTEQVIDNKLKTEEIINIFGKYTDSLHITGNGDPFASKVFREFLINFDETKFPLLQSIVIYTNANLLNEEMWNKMSKIHKYVNHIEISIDAATEETYKKVRRNGNWKRLFENIKFILTIPTISTINYSFVVQDINYREMFDFANMITNLQHKINYRIFFIRILNYGTFTEEEYKIKKIWDKSHPEFPNFLVEVNKLVNMHNVHFDMKEIIDKYSLLGIKKLI